MQILLSKGWQCMENYAFSLFSNLDCKGKYLYWYCVIKSQIFLDCLQTAVTEFWQTVQAHQKCKIKNIGQIKSYQCIHIWKYRKVKLWRVMKTWRSCLVVKCCFSLYWPIAAIMWQEFLMGKYSLVYNLWATCLFRDVCSEHGTPHTEFILCFRFIQGCYKHIKSFCLSECRQIVNGHDLLSSCNDVKSSLFHSWGHVLYP